MSHSPSMGNLRHASSVETVSRKPIPASPFERPRTDPGIFAPAGRRSTGLVSLVATDRPGADPPSWGTRGSIERTIRMTRPRAEGFLRLLAAGLLLLGAFGPSRAQTAWTLPSPSGQVTMTVRLEDGTLRYSVSREGALVLQESELGIERADAQFATGLMLVSASEPILVDEEYVAPHGKASHLRNHAAEQTLELRNPDGDRILLVFRAYDDGAAFRYSFPDSSVLFHTVTDERTTYRFAGNGRAVLQSFWPESLHEIVPLEDPPGGAGGWALPALFDLGHSWVLLAESDVEKSYFAAHLDEGDEVREYRIKVPETGYGVREPTWKLPWEMPWRAIVVGPDPATVVRSNLVSHLADSSRVSDTAWIRPGRVSWHWWARQPVGSMQVLRSYVDFAQSMGWEYSLVDADWDDYHSDEEMQGLVDYAAARGVGIFLWYNCAGPQNDYTFSPRDRMWDTQIRRAEMAKLSDWGVTGIKVDFFDSEKQTMIQRYQGILEDAAEEELLVCFHGSTPPRGWYRTWPHMMTTEAVRGAEYYLIDHQFPEAAPLHNVRLAFTRNVVGPMDYTPVTFSDEVYQHLTTNAHELALSVVFESGLVHLADDPDSYRAQPEVVQDFLREVPASWDEIRFLEGDPSTHVVLARRKGEDWYLAGINGTTSSREVVLDLAGFDYAGVGAFYIGDGETPRTFAWDHVWGTDFALTLAPRGGFVLRIPGDVTGAPGPPIEETSTEDEERLRLSIDGILPNPFTTTARIACSLSGGAPARLVVYDVAGRRIRSLPAAARPGTTHRFLWDGTDDAGLPVAAGVYFVRLTAGGRSVTKRVQRVR
ncbi:MAG: T9SS type A sorting domain-containing protein [Candidatus Eisenbacteria bacterium]|nr:T9SS type A sorting domain-containing protein [Candidatus Latescibacterota bacterium]MBD3302034.1 T9SS type A sorting domain-containing protein [Candidatus Eisenbacteria bacterium]